MNLFHYKIMLWTKWLDMKVCYLLQKEKISLPSFLARSAKFDIWYRAQLLSSSLSFSLVFYSTQSNRSIKAFFTWHLFSLLNFWNKRNWQSRGSIHMLVVKSATSCSNRIERLRLFCLWGIIVLILFFCFCHGWPFPK